MVAAKEKTLNLLSVVTLVVLAALVLVPASTMAASTASTSVVKATSNYDSHVNKISKPHYGSSEMFLTLASGHQQRLARHAPGEIDLHLRRLHMGLGTIYFRARYYDPATGEFASRDPVEYVDGMSLMRGMLALDRIDPDGRMTIDPAPGVRLSGACRGAPLKMSWNWLLDTKSGELTAAPCSGWIVQRVQIVCGIGRCWDFRYTKNQRGVRCCGCQVPEAREIIVYWEAWRVTQDGDNRRPDGPKYVGDRYDDRAFWDHEMNTCGEYQQDGEVRFYCDDDHADVAGIADNWAQGATFGRNCPTSSGNLHATDNKPDFWDTVDARDSGFRRFRVNWRCCDCDGRAGQWVNGDAFPLVKTKFTGSDREELK